MLEQRPAKGRRLHIPSGDSQPNRSTAWLFPLIGALLILGLMLAYYAQTWGSVEAFVVAIDHCEKLFCDFTNHYYPMGRSLFWTRSPVPGYFYTPFFALLLVPFGRVPLDTSLWLWGAVQALLLIALLVVPGRSFLKRSPVSFYLYISLVASSLPILHNLKWGQVSVLMTLCAILALLLHRKGYSVAAAIVLAFATWVKYYTALFLIIFLLKRDTRFLLTFLVTSLILALILPLGALGIQDGVGFYREVNRAAADANSWVPQDVNSQNVAHVAWRLAGDESAEINLQAVTVIGYLIAAANIVLAYLSMRAGIRRWDEWTFVLLFASLPFLLSTSWPHYFVYLPFCQAVLVEHLLVESPAAWWRKLPGGLLLVASAMLSSSFFFIFLGDRSVYSGSGFLFFANLLTLVVAYLGLVPQLLRRNHAEQRVLQEATT